MRLSCILGLAGYMTHARVVSSRRTWRRLCSNVYGWVKALSVCVGEQCTARATFMRGLEMKRTWLGLLRELVLGLTCLAEIGLDVGLFGPRLRLLGHDLDQEKKRVNRP